MSDEYKLVPLEPWIILGGPHGDEIINLPEGAYVRQLESDGIEPLTCKICGRLVTKGSYVITGKPKPTGPHGLLRGLTVEAVYCETCWEQHQ